MSTQGCLPRETDLSGLPTCRDCGGGLLFSARELGTGLCHSCAHKHLAAGIAGNAGLTLRQHYAGLAMMGLMAMVQYGQDVQSVARKAWETADEMISQERTTV